MSGFCREKELGSPIFDRAASMCGENRTNRSNQLQTSFQWEFPLPPPPPVVLLQSPLSSAFKRKDTPSKQAPLPPLTPPPSHSLLLFLSLPSSPPPLLPPSLPSLLPLLACLSLPLPPLSCQSRGGGIGGDGGGGRKGSLIPDPCTSLSDFCIPII